MRITECKHVTCSADWTGEKTIRENMDLIAIVRSRAVMTLYKSLTPEERETIMCIDLEPTLDDTAAYRGVFYANPDIDADERGMWKAELDKIAAGKHSKLDENGEIRCAASGKF